MTLAQAPRALARLFGAARARAGFTLLETLAALALGAAILGVVASISSQTLRNWNRGQQSLAAMEMLTRGIGRLSLDLSRAIPMRPPGSERPDILFAGDARKLIFVSATGLGAGNRGVELISVSVEMEGEDTVVVRRRGPVASLTAQMSDPVPLLRGRLDVRFWYRDRDGRRTDQWLRQSVLPSALELEVRAAGGEPVFPAGVILPVPTNLSADCIASDDEEDEDRNKRCGIGAPQPQAQPAAQDAAQRGQAQQGQER